MTPPSQISRNILIKRLFLTISMTLIGMTLLCCSSTLIAGAEIAPIGASIQSRTVSLATTLRKFSPLLVSYSLSIQRKDRSLSICPTSDHPFLFRVEVPESMGGTLPARYFYALFTMHTFPLELLMTTQKLNALVDHCAFAVGELGRMAPKPVSKKQLSQEGLTLDAAVREEFLTKEKEGESDKSGLEREKELESQKQWLDHWDEHLPPYAKTLLESNQTLPLSQEVLPLLHPALAMTLIVREKKFQSEKILYQFGIDNALANLFCSQGKKWHGLEDEHDRLETGDWEDLRESVGWFMNSGLTTPLKMLQCCLKAQVPKTQQVLQRPYWASDNGPFAEGKPAKDNLSVNYYKGKIPTEPAPEAVMNRSNKWKPKINALVKENTEPWLLAVGLHHAEELLQWFCHKGWQVGRIKKQV